MPNWLTDRAALGPAAHKELSNATSGRPARLAPECLSNQLLDRDSRAGCFQFGLQFFCICLGHGFLDLARNAFDQVLGFLEAEAGCLANLLDDADLVIAKA